MRRPESTFLYDTLRYRPRSRARFGGSCGYVAHAFADALEKWGHDVRELYVPLKDKTSRLRLPPAADPRARGFHIFFEELFLRTERDAEYARAPKVVYFNLHFFAQIERFCRADALIFNSKYLMDCFAAQCARRKLRAPYLGYVPLPVPLLDFPDGYASYGDRIRASALKDLRKTAFVGHAMRGRKADCFSTLAILHLLNGESRRRGTKPFKLLVPASDMPRFKAERERSGLPKSALRHLVPVPHLQNRSMVQVMRNSDFALCYDRVVEAFGFYPVESVYSGCPVFTNGAGNLRHLLPIGCGIAVDENIGMYFGTTEERLRAHGAVAKAILESVVSGTGAKACRKGRNYIRKFYSPAAFARKLKAELGKARKAKAKATKTKTSPNPYLRLADFRAGRFVTDLAIFEAKGLKDGDRKLYEF